MLVKWLFTGGMKKIILFRSVRLEEMGYVLKDVIGEFGKDSEITVITRPENEKTMKAFPEVKIILLYRGHTFTLSKVSEDEKAELKNNKFDIAIIPTNGNVSSYDNVFSFSKGIFEKIPTYFHLYSNTFIFHKFSIFNNTFKTLIKTTSILIAIPLTALYLLNYCYRSPRKCFS